MVIKKSFTSLTKTPHQLSALQKAITALEQQDEAYLAYIDGVEAEASLTAAQLKKRQKTVRPRQEKIWEKPLLSPEATHYMAYVAVLEIAIDDLFENIQEQWKLRRGSGELGPHHVLGHILGDLSIPRQTTLIQHENLGPLMQELGRMRKHIDVVLKNHPKAAEWKLDAKSYLDATRDLKTSAHKASLKTSEAIGLIIMLVALGLTPSGQPKQGRPSVRGWSDQKEMLSHALKVVRDVTTHLIESWKEEREAFLNVGDRRKQVEFRRDRHKPSTKG